MKSGLIGVSQIVQGALSAAARQRWCDPRHLQRGNQPVRPRLLNGANIWVANRASNTVTKLRASDGALQGTFSVGISPSSVAFDGANIWVTNNISGTVTKLRASDGALQGTFSVKISANGVAFDGANIWVAYSGGVSKL
jgi:hypothetical protein